MSASNLPVGWAETILSELVDFVRGVTYNKNQSSDTFINGYLPILRANNIQNDRLILDNLVYVESSLIKPVQKIQKNDIIVAMSSGSKSVVGKAGTAAESMDAGFGTFCGLLRPIAQVNPKLISFFTRTAYYRNTISHLSAGANINNLRLDHFSKLIFPFPPLAEQKVIADKLEILLALVDAPRARLKNIQKTLKIFRQSVLTSAVSGKLTEEWRRQNDISIEHWLCTNVGALAEVATGKTPKRTNSKYWEGGTVPWLTSAATGSTFTIEADQFVTELAVKECSLRIFPIGTLLLAMYGEGKTRGQVTEIQLEATCNQACAAILIDETKISKEFLKILLQENYEETRKAAAGGAQPNLNLNKVREIPLGLPSKLEQCTIVRRVEELFTFADSIEQKVDSALARVNNLSQSILAKAFRGELTTDWRTANPELIHGDNGAEALMKRIKIEREATKKQNKPKRSVAKEKTGNRMNKQIIKVVEALKQTGEPLSGQQLLAAAGYPSDSNTDQLELFFLDVRDALAIEKSIVKLERDIDGQDWFALAHSIHQ